MNSGQFDQVVEEVIDSIKQTLLIKAKEYRRNGNPFHNFDEGARKTGLIREKVLDGMLLKHEISIADITNDLENGILPNKNTLDEKFGDNIIYLILKKASIIDRILQQREKDIDEERKRKQASSNIEEQKGIPQEGIFVVIQ